MFELSKRKDGNPGSPKRLGAEDRAIFHKYQTPGQREFEKAGGWIGDYSGYITRTSHDPDKIRQPGFVKWKDAIRDKLD